MTPRTAPRATLPVYTLTHREVAIVQYRVYIGRVHTRQGSTGRCRAAWVHHLGTPPTYSTRTYPARQVRPVASPSAYRLPSLTTGRHPGWRASLVGAPRRAREASRTRKDQERPGPGSLPRTPLSALLRKMARIVTFARFAQNNQNRHFCSFCHFCPESGPGPGWAG